MKSNPTPAILPIHFDVIEQYLSADDYLIAIKSIQTTLNEINIRIFDGKIDFEFLVFPPEKASFKAIFGIGATLIMGMFINAVSPIASGVLEGLGYDEIRLKNIGKDGVSILFKDIAAEWYSIENCNLEKIIPEEVNLDKAIKAKSDFYNMCLRNKGIKGIGFNDEEDFPIKREDFWKHISKDNIKDVVLSSIIEVIIVSPVNTNDKERPWLVKKEIDGSYIPIGMKDINFKRDFLNGKYPLKKSKADDRMIILLEEHQKEVNGEIQSKKYIVNTVYSFNKIEIITIDLQSNLETKKQPYKKIKESEQLPLL